MTAEEASEADKAVEKLALRSRNEYFLWLHKRYMNRQHDFQDQFLTILDRLEDHLDHKLQQINTAAQINVALLNAFVKYAVSALPDIPAELRQAAVQRGERRYEKIATTAMREFRVRRLNRHYEPEWFDDPASEPASGSEPEATTE